MAAADIPPSSSTATNTCNSRSSILLDVADYGVGGQSLDPCGGVDEEGATRDDLVTNGPSLMTFATIGGWSIGLASASMNVKVGRDSAGHGCGAGSPVEPARTHR
jgi:hypothetical protein